MALAMSSVITALTFADTDTASPRPVLPDVRIGQAMAVLAGIGSVQVPVRLTGCGSPTSRPSGSLAGQTSPSQATIRAGFDPGVLRRVFMAPRAMGLVPVNRRGAVRSPVLVLAACDRFQVVRITTRRVLALVVDLLAIGNRSDRDLVHRPVNVHPAIEPVALGVAVSLPFPAPRCNHDDARKQLRQGQGLHKPTVPTVKDGA